MAQERQAKKQKMEQQRADAAADAHAHLKGRFHTMLVEPSKLFRDHGVQALDAWVDQLRPDSKHELQAALVAELFGDKFLDHVVAYCAGNPDERDNGPVNKVDGTALLCETLRQSALLVDNPQARNPLFQFAKILMTQGKIARSRDLDELQPPTADDKAFLEGLWTWWLGLAIENDAPNAICAYLAGKWEILPQLLQKSVVSMKNILGGLASNTNYFDEPTNARVHLTCLAWGLRH
jgi:hypothetical protein